MFLAQSHCCVLAGNTCTLSCQFDLFYVQLTQSSKLSNAHCVILSLLENMNMKKSNYLPLVKKQFSKSTSTYLTTCHVFFSSHLFQICLQALFDFFLFAHFYTGKQRASKNKAMLFMSRRIMQKHSIITPRPLVILSKQFQYIFLWIEAMLISHVDENFNICIQHVPGRILIKFS